MHTLLTRAAVLVRDTLSGRRHLRTYDHPDAHRHQHNRYAGLARDYVRTAPPMPVGGSGM
ncbi:hypothetical protein ADL04_17930 [Streptomyces sp. NRRL B-3648]|nr:hypothetical protein ADL04_17930 [Streptomyces sp. NRRL B-3648]